MCGKWKKIMLVLVVLEKVGGFSYIGAHKSQVQGGQSN